METASIKPSPRLFWLITAGYLAIAIVASAANWEGMERMAPNEWGDVFAGVFSPLALLWFLYTALAQRAELRLQHEELRNNTRAQDAQEEQMQRQANALDAQVQRLRAQADALYQPILVLTTSSGGTPGTVTLHIRNHGSSVLDVSVPIFGRIVATSVGAQATTMRGALVPHWPSGSSLYIELEDAARTVDGEAQDRTFSLQMRRLDLALYVHTYRYIAAEQRLFLESALEIPPGSRNE